MNVVPMLNSMQPKLKLPLLILALLCFPMFGRAQGTAFSYQGHLLDNAVAANGNYDFIFALFDAEANGNQIGLDVTLDNTLVANGLFNASLDFGPDNFLGDARWLEISIRPTGGGAYTTLAARAALLPTPYSMFAAKAGSVADGAVTANQLSTTGIAPRDGQFLTYSGGSLLWSDADVAAGNIWSKSGADAYYSAGNVGIGLSSPTVGVRLEVNGNARFHPSGGIPGGFLAIGNPGGESGLSIIGNNRADVRFDDSSLKLLAGLGTGAMPSANGIVITTAGNVGIGTNNPTAGVKLEVNGVTKVNSGGSGGYAYFHTPSGESGMSIIGNNRADVRFDGSSLKLLAGFGSGAMPSENGIAITTAGSVGIGTTTPVAKLDVENSQSGKSAVYGTETGTFGVGVYGEATAASGAGVFARNLNGVALNTDGNAVQSRDKGGFVKAMVHMHYDGSGDSAIPTFIRGYNGVTGAATGLCGFTYDHYVESFFANLHTTIDFGFTVNDRFISLTSINGGEPQAVSVFGFPNAHTIDIRNDGDFYIIVF